MSSEMNVCRNSREFGNQLASKLDFPDRAFDFRFRTFRFFVLISHMDHFRNTIHRIETSEAEQGQFLQSEGFPIFDGTHQ